MLGRVREQKIKRVRKTEKDGERGEIVKFTKRAVFPFCVHLAANGESNDRPVSEDQSRRQILHSRDGTILK
jgi:hypothetical protein